MKKLFLTIILSFVLLSCNYISSPNYTYNNDGYMLKNKSWERYGKLNSLYSYYYGNHRFDFDNSDKVVYSLNGNFEKLYKWRIDYDGTFQMMAENQYVWKDIELDIINSYTIELDGLKLRRVYN